MSELAVVFWDVDGTLLTTGRAGIFALEAALQEIYGKSCGLHALATAGLTDAEVVALAIRVAGEDASDEAVDALLRVYEAHLPECLHRRDGHVMPGVVAILEDLASHDGVVSLLLTGNTRRGAKAKLAHYGLDSYFTRGGAFCASRETREEIARAAASLANGTKSDRMIVVGDTPHDVRAGLAIGARVVAVATGSYEPPALAGAWVVLDRLPDPTTFRGFVGLR